MRIISKFRDYYDNASGYGIDLECIFLRESKKIEYKTNNGSQLYNNYPRFSSLSHIRGHSGVLYEAQPMVLGYCGKMIPFIKVSYLTNYSFQGKTETSFFYNKLDFMNFMNKNGFNMKGMVFYGIRFNDFGLRGEKSIERFFNHKFNDLDFVFSEYNVPYFIYHNEHGVIKMETNPKLMDIQFQSQKDSVNCFQEIFMYISGVLGSKEKEIKNISDKDKIQQHGFDKWSFRKPPENK